MENSSFSLYAPIIPPKGRAVQRADAAPAGTGKKCGPRPAFLRQEFSVLTNLHKNSKIKLIKEVHTHRRRTVDGSRRAHDGRRANSCGAPGACRHAAAEPQERPKLYGNAM